MLSGHHGCVQKSKDTSHAVTGPRIMTCLFGMASITNLAGCHQGFSEEHNVFITTTEKECGKSLLFFFFNFPISLWKTPFQSKEISFLAKCF